MKGVVLYSPKWTKKHPELFTELQEKTKDECPIMPYSDYFVGMNILKTIINLTADGFDDIIKKSLISLTQDFTYSECCTWILQNPNDKLTSCMCVCYDDNDKPKELYVGLENIRYLFDVLNKIKGGC